MEVKGSFVEEIGFKAFQKGFFEEWRSLTFSLHSQSDLPLHEIAELAYEKCKGFEVGR